MTKIQKIALILAWFLLVTLLLFLLNNAFVRLFPNFSEETRSFLAFISAVTLSAFLLDQTIKRSIQMKKQFSIRQKLNTNIPNSPDDLFLFYLNDWNIYNLKLDTNHSPFPFLSQKKIEWILPFTSFQDKEKSQLLKRVKMTNQKLYIIQDEPPLKKAFIKNIKALFEEKKIDYAVLLQNKESFLNGFPAEKYEILETRDILETLLEIIEKFNTKKERNKHEKELDFEDKILKTATQKSFILNVPEVEVSMRPKSFWWWKKAQIEPQKA